MPWLAQLPFKMAFMSLSCHLSTATMGRNFCKVSSTLHNVEHHPKQQNQTTSCKLVHIQLRRQNLHEFHLVNASRRMLTHLITCAGEFLVPHVMMAVPPAALRLAPHTQYTMTFLWIRR